MRKRQKTGLTVLLINCQSVCYYSNEMQQVKAETEKHTLYPGGLAMKRIVVQEGTKVISNYCYAGDRDISSVCAADSLTDIGVGAFKDCTGLETVILNEGLSRLRKEVFSGCENLSQINIPGTVHSIGEWAFRGCRNLHELRIPETVNEICAESFLDCPNLTIVAEEGSFAADFAKKNGIPLLLV